MKQVMIYLLETHKEKPVIACVDLIHCIDSTAFLSSVSPSVHLRSDGKIVNI